MAPRSKRARKQKDKLSLRAKSGGGGGGVASGGDAFDSNAFILPAAAAPAAAADADADAPPAPRLSKSQQRKLKKVAEEKERRAARAETYASLAANQLGTAEMELLRPMASRGQRDTKRQALRRALRLERAGVGPPLGARLYKEGRGAGGAAESSGEEDEDEESSDEEAAAGAAPQASGRAALPAPMDADDSSGGDGGSSSDDGAAAAGAPAGKRPRLDPAAAIAARRAVVAAAKAELGVAAAPGRDDDEAPAGAPPPPRAPAPGPARVVLVERPPAIAAAREGLPIVAMEQEIMEAVAGHDVLVLCGATGSGKTTQVPQFLLEAGYGSARFPERAGAIGVTQPRRVAAAASAARVAAELGGRVGGLVGYQVRHDRRAGAGTAIKFMTDGILLREAQADLLLRAYSAVVVDEAHERSLNTDILLGLLSRVVALRRRLADAADAAEAAGAPPADAAERVRPLKLIIMSATLRTADFVGNRRLFPAPPPLLAAPARQFPVTVHFARRTEERDYVGAALRKAAAIHANLPPGGILIFLTGQREVEFACRKLRAQLGPRRGKGAGGAAVETAANGDADSDEADEADAAGGVGGWSGGDAAEADAGAAVGEALLLAGLGDGDGARDDYAELSADEDEEEVVVMGAEGLSPEEVAAAEAAFEAALPGGGAPTLAAAGTDGARPAPGAAAPVHVLPLYAALAPAAQARVFAPPPEGARLIVVATNVAETSLTIPGIRYVVDAGRAKQRLLEEAGGAAGGGGLARYEVRWVSQAAAEQRAGRAGRTGPGHAYRLFSSAVFADVFPPHAPPEIANAPLEGVALSLRALGVERVANFPFPTPPAAGALAAAERCLAALGALAGGGAGGGALTELGRRMAALPVSPRHARMLLEVARAAEGEASAAAAEAEAGGGGAQRKKEGKRERRRRTMDAAALLPYAVALAAALSVESPFVHVDGLGGAEAEAADAAASGAEAAAAAAAARRGAARAAHAALRVGSSDALGALAALCAFEAAGEAEGFARANFLHFRNLREAAALRRQLARVLGAAAAGLAPAGAAAALAVPPAAPPPRGALAPLARALAAGWADQVARRVRSAEHVAGAGGAAAARGRGRAVRYRSCAHGVEEDIFLHPSSALAASAPEFVAYCDLVRTDKRPYMAGVTAVEPRWLAPAAPALAPLSPPLAAPPPFYSAVRDATLCWREPSYGRHAWVLPPLAAELPDAGERAAVFAAALLEGRVVSALGALRPALALPPASALRPELRAHKRVAGLLEALRAARVSSRAALFARWRDDPAFLRPEVGAWVRDGGGGALAAAWAAALAEAGA
jgi:ATP-dependent RNA helicase DHX37/DHR1